MIRQGMQLARPVLAFVLGLAAAGACYRDRGSGGALEHRAEPARGAAAAAADELAFLPMDADVVIGLDAQQIFGSALWKHLEPQLMQRLGQGLQELRAACGYDPFAALRSVTVGAKAGGGSFDGVLVVRGLERDRTMACAGRALAQRARVTIEGGVVTISQKPGEPPVVMTFADPRTLVIAPSRAKLDAALASGAPLRRSRAFSELWALIDAKQALWAIANGGSSAFDGLSALGIRPRAMFGSVALGDGLTMTGRLRLASADEATQLAATVQGQLGPAQAMVDRVEVGADGVDLTLRVSMTTAQLDTIIRMTSGMWGGGSPLGGP